MKAKVIWTSALFMVGFWAALAATSLAEEKVREAKEGKGIALDTRKIEESETKGSLEAPHYGYIGQLGSFEVTRKNASGKEPHGFIVVHHYPHQGQLALGHTRLKYQGPKRLGNVDGWVFETDWDGKVYPAKVFFSAQKIYFGAGVKAYIAADYRTGSGWVWKMLPLRRMELARTGTEVSEK